MTSLHPTLSIAAACLVGGLGLPPTSVSAAEDMTLGPVVRSTLGGCDAPTPVRAADGAIYSNVSDCSVNGSGGGGKVSTGWARVQPSVRWMPSALTTYGNGADGLKLSGAIVDGGILYLIERNLTRGGGMRVGRSSRIDRPRPTWTGKLRFGWGSFAQASPDGFQYVYLRDSRTAYGTADRVDLARALKGRLADLGAWEVFTGSSTAPAWLPWANRASRQPVLTDPGRIDRPHVTYLKGCWTMAVTIPPLPGTRGGNGLAVHTSANPYGPWNRRFYLAGKNLGESAQFSPLWPGRLLLTEGDRFEWRSYSLPAGC